MTKWLLLLAAILSEVSATLALKAALGHPGWYAVTIVGYLVSFTLLSACLRAGLKIGVAYGIWAAGGVTLTAGAASVIFDEPFTALMGVGVALIIAGVLMVELGSQQAQRAQDPSNAEVAT